jgi:pimeloyl-ACP methyl ester carboxylesterase
VIERDRRLRHGRVRFVELGDGPPLVLLHGLGGNWRNWQANLPALAQRHRVIALDLPGFGGSEPYPGAVTVARYVDTVVELLDQLQIPRATFVGNSMGGLLTIETAVRHPDRVNAAILVCSGGIPLTSLRHRLVTIPQARAVNRVLRLRLSRRAVNQSHLVRLLLGGQIFHDPGTIPPDLLAVALNGLGAPGFGPALAAAAGYDARLRAPAVGCPTLQLWGRQDPLLPLAMGEELHRRIPGSRLEVWDETGHCPMLENPARFDELVTTFVATSHGPRP